MINFTLKNIPRTLHARLKKQAAEHRRSLNSEILNCLEQAVVAEGGNAGQVLESARCMRKYFKHELTDEALQKYKNSGRA